MILSGIINSFTPQSNTIYTGAAVFTGPIHLGNLSGVTFDGQFVLSGGTISPGAGNNHNILFNGFDLGKTNIVIDGSGSQADTLFDGLAITNFKFAGNCIYSGTWDSTKNKCKNLIVSGGTIVNDGTTQTNKIFGNNILNFTFDSILITGDNINGIDVGIFQVQSGYGKVNNCYRDTGWGYLIRIWLTGDFIYTNNTDLNTRHYGSVDVRNDPTITGWGGNATIKNNISGNKTDDGSYVTSMVICGAMSGHTCDIENNLSFNAIQNGGSNNTSLIKDNSGGIGVITLKNNLDFTGPILSGVTIPANIGSNLLNNMNFTQITGDFTAPGRGARHWGTTDWDDTFAPTIPSGNKVPLNYYTRFNWLDIESDTVQGSYSWAVFDAFVNLALANNAMFSFGLMAYCDGCGAGGAVPSYLQALMTAEGKPCWLSSDSGAQIPNWQSTNYANRYIALMQAVAAHITANGWDKAFLGYDLRHFDDYGEGGLQLATAPNGPVPAGAQVTDTYIIKITDAAIAAFPNVQLTVPMGYVAPENSNYNNADGNVGASAAYHILTVSNNYGRIGWRRDDIGDDGYNAYITANTGSFNGVAFKPMLINCWQVAPVGGEPANDNTAVSRCGQPFCDVHNEDTLFHMSYFGNGNYPNTVFNIKTLWNQQNANMRAASAEQGYRIILTGGSASGSNGLSVSLNWQNIGNAPTYEKWDVWYQLKSGTKIVWSGKSSMQLRYFLPSSGSTSNTDTFTGISGGTYALSVVIKDPLGYKAPLPLAITGRAADGSYSLGNVTIAGGVQPPPANKAPIANAGPDMSSNNGIVTIVGSGTDADGAVVSYLWQLSGVTVSTSPSFTAPRSIPGKYVYTLTVTDNQGATGSDSMVLTVNAPPVAKVVGPSDIKLLGATVTLSGSGSTDSAAPIVSYQWIVPSGITVDSTTNREITMSGLQPNTYQVVLGITDSFGNVDSIAFQFTVHF